MLVRLVLAATCSVVAVKYAQLKASQHQCPNCQEHLRSKKSCHGKKVSSLTVENDASKEKEKENEQPRTLSRQSSCKSLEESDQVLLPEFDELIKGSAGFSSDSKNHVNKEPFQGHAIRMTYESEGDESKLYDSNSDDDEALQVFQALTSSENNVLSHKQCIDGNLCTCSLSEVARLKALVAELEQREMNLEAELFEYYGLKEQENNYVELEKQLERKNWEIEKLNGELISLDGQSKKLVEELKAKENVKHELKAAKAKIKDLQKSMQIDAGETKAQLLNLKEHVSILQKREEETSRKYFDLEVKYHLLKEKEVEIEKLRRAYNELQREKSELVNKLGAAEAKIAELMKEMESNTQAKVNERTTALRIANGDLTKQVEAFQTNRFCEIEELVHLRWLNACLRYELKNNYTLPRRGMSMDLGRNSNPRSFEHCKQFMVDFPFSEILATKNREQSEQDYESVNSRPSTPTEPGDESSFDGGLSRSKKTSIIKKFKKWARNKGDSQMSSATSADTWNSSSRTLSPGHRYLESRGSTVETSITRGSSDFIATTTHGMGYESARHSTSDSNESFGESTITKVTFDDTSKSCGNFAASYEVMSRSAADVQEENYLNLKDRHKLAVAREKSLKERCDHARSQRITKKPNSVTVESNKMQQLLGGNSHLNGASKLEVQIVSAKDGNSIQLVVNKIKLAEVQKRSARTPNPKPKPSAKIISDSENVSESSELGVLLPPSPPTSLGTLKLLRAQEIVQFYQALMERESPNSVLAGPELNCLNAQNSMIGEIVNRSTFALEVKADVETQGDFVESLARDVRDVAYDNMEDVVAFVSWLDDELSFLVEERAVLHHFDWPESKCNTLREAAFDYEELKKLEAGITSFEDDPYLSSDLAFKKMLYLLEALEQSLFPLLRTRDMAIARYKAFNVPTEWMLDSGLIGKIKLSSVKLARKYMKRVLLELKRKSMKEPEREYLLLQGVRFAYRVHQLAGGFDVESLQEFEELRSQARFCAGE